MSKAREKFFEAIDFLADQMYMTIAENIVTHVTDIESKVEQLEAEKAELIEFAKEIAYNDIGSPYGWVQTKAWEFMNKYKGE